MSGRWSVLCRIQLRASRSMLVGVANKMAGLVEASPGFAFPWDPNWVFVV
jgi:hypothetical protein